VLDRLSNNAAVACPCGKILVISSFIKGRFCVRCGRKYVALPPGQKVTEILVTERGAESPAYSLDATPAGP
jgi:hypothetical protein